MYLWSRVLLSGDVESNPGQLMEMMLTLMYTVNFVSIVLFSTVVLLKLLFMIYRIP